MLLMLNGNFDPCVTYVNGWLTAIYMSYMSQNFRCSSNEFLHSKLSNLSAHVSEATVS